jgi:superfamily II DNA or RNA helicase/HKD family nuclease
VPDWFSATADEQAAILFAIDTVRQSIEKQYSPSGYNLGVNIGTAAGQTIPHLHLHFIPRYEGDVADPRGGVRFVIPDKANYLAGPAHDGAPHARPLVRGADDPLLPHLVAHLTRATRVDIAVAFTMSSGVRLLIEHLRDVIGRDGHVRLLTGDYLDVTEPDALRQLLDLGEMLELRIFESAGTSFHLKSYIALESDDRGTAFVGSSNLSQSALKAGIEWNYRVVTSRDGAGFQSVCAEFDRLFAHERTTAVDADWITAYEKRRAKRHPGGIVPPDGALPPEPPIPIAVPHELQRDALTALHATRAAGNGAGLVVLATGLGKTWLAAFDTAQAQAGRVLFVAHREEILDQAMRTFRAIRPKAVLGKYTGEEKTLDADVTFASIQTLGRRTHLDRFAADTFDYIVVDEFHHASAATYRRLLDHFTPRFLLGLTATPERTDGADLLALCGENLVYRADLVEGIRRGLLSPFDYYGVPDEVDYAQIPWRSTRFDEEALTTAVATTTRADNALDHLRRRGGTKTIAFCVSQRHADFMHRHFRNAGLRTASVHAGSTSDPRTRSLERLQAGELDVLFAVDMFNEGVDVPDIDTVLMLRPTESPVLWLQQFGRGLRWRPGKRLKVIDYIGNHRTFLLKPRTLFQLDGGDAQLSYALRLLDEGREAQLLPPGCSVTYDLEAKEILRALIRPSGEGLTEFYREFRERTGTRPTATETFHALFDPKSARRGYGSWFQFVRAMGDLDGAWDEAEVRTRSFLSALEVTPMTRSFKMVVLLAMLAEDALPGSIDVRTLAHRVQVLARRSATLREEFGPALEDEAGLVALLEEHPIAAWTEGRGTGGERFFTYEHGTLSTAFSVPAALRAPAVEMIREVAEWRLAVYLRRTGMEAGADRIACRVSHAGDRPILFLPSRERFAGIPQGWVDVTADGETYQAKFAKIAVNVMQLPNQEENVLPAVLRRWFGPGAGQPGTTQTVEFVRSGGGYLLTPAQGGAMTGPVLWTRYTRADVPKLFGFDFRGFESQSGVVEREKLILLFVTLDKSGKPDEHRYDDGYTGPTQFRWQSQNRTKRDSEAGRRISEHAARGISVHLFVRAMAKVRGVTQPFVYAGPLNFVRWEGDNPITVDWMLGAAVPEHLRAELGVPGVDRSR